MIYVFSLQDLKYAMTYAWMLTSRILRPLQDGVSQHPDSPASPLTQLDIKETPMEQTEKSPRQAKQERIINLQRDPFYIPRLMRRILLTKGREVTPKQVYWNFSYRDRPSVALIHQVMKELANKGLGEYGKNERKTTFSKREPWTMGTMLNMFGIEMIKYEKQFYALEPTSGSASFGQ